MVAVQLTSHIAYCLCNYSDISQIQPQKSNNNSNIDLLIIWPIIAWPWLTYWQSATFNFLVIQSFMLVFSHMTMFTNMLQHQHGSTWTGLDKQKVPINQKWTKHTIFKITAKKTSERKRNMISVESSKSHSWLGNIFLMVKACHRKGFNGVYIMLKISKVCTWHRLYHAPLWN